MDSVLLRLFHEFRRSPVEFIDRLSSAVNSVAGYLIALSKYLRDNLRRVEELRSADLNLKNALRIAVRKLHGIVLKVGEYIDLAETLCGMANHQREATIRREIVGRIDEGDESTPFFPKLEAFLAELNSRIEALDKMRGVIEKLCDQFMRECTSAFNEAEKKEEEAGSWKSMLGTVAVVLGVGGLGVATGGLGFIAFGAATAATTAVAGAGAAGVSAAGFGGAYKAYKKSGEFSQLEDDFRQKKKNFDDLRRDTNRLQVIADTVEVSHSENIKTETRCCERWPLPESVENLFKKLRSVDFAKARDGVMECTDMYVRQEHED